jgi:hypothetical protein
MRDLSNVTMTEQNKDKARYAGIIGTTYFALDVRHA